MHVSLAWRAPRGAILELELWYDLRTFSGNLASLSRHEEKDAVKA